jgi:hypothetical protein
MNNPNSFYFILSIFYDWNNSFNGIMYHGREIGIANAEIKYEVN